MGDTHTESDVSTVGGASFAAWLNRPYFKYTGFALLLAWHYALWFVPDLYCNLELMDNRVTASWIVNLVAMPFFLVVFAVALHRKRHLSDCRAALPASCAILFTGTIALGTIPFQLPEALFYLISAVLGAGEAALWVLWGERYARVKANFTLNYFGTVFGVTLLACVGIAFLLPLFFGLVFVSLMPVASGLMLRAMRKGDPDAFPVLLPKSATNSATKNMVGVGLVTLFACTACYFIDCIIVWQELPTYDSSFTFGILCGAVLVLAIAAIYTLSQNRLNIFKIYPTLLIVVMAAFALYLASTSLHFTAFIVGIGAQTLFEVLLIMYFGILTSKGYATPAFTFAMAGGFVRIGLALGNSLALWYESMPEVARLITPETCLVFMCLLAAVLIPLVRLEFSIVALTTIAPNKSEIEEICAEVASEFALSAREGEILLLIARGHTTKSMAGKLVISPYTVNTHIRHIYDKMQIHKRSELLNYLNMQRSDF